MGSGGRRPATPGGAGPPRRTATGRRCPPPSACLRGRQQEEGAPAGPPGLSLLLSPVDRAGPRPVGSGGRRRAETPGTGPRRTAGPLRPSARLGPRPRRPRRRARPPGRPSPPPPPPPPGPPPPAAGEGGGPRRATPSPAPPSSPNQVVTVLRPCSRRLSGEVVAGGPDVGCPRSGRRRARAESGAGKSHGGPVSPPTLPHGVPPREGGENKRKKTRGGESCLQGRRFPLLSLFLTWDQMHCISTQKVPDSISGGNNKALCGSSMAGVVASSHGLVGYDICLT